MLIDCHNHSLPSIDDGARDLDMALAMAACAAENGFGAIIVTPHHLNGVFENRRIDILRQVFSFRSKAAEHGIKLDIYPGAENHLTSELIGELEAGDAMTYVDRGRAVLVELPKRALPSGAEYVLRRLISQDVTPVIAHPERNSELLHKPELAGQWVEMGCKLQLTGQSCSGHFGRNIQAICKRWLVEGIVHLVGSDAHRPTGRSPDLNPALEILEDWMGERNTELLTGENPARLISGEALGSTGAIPPKRSLFSGLFTGREKG